jgi:hypothetical protein
MQVFRLRLAQERQTSLRMTPQVERGTITSLFGKDFEEEISDAQDA